MFSDTSLDLGPICVLSLSVSSHHEHDFPIASSVVKFEGMKFVFNLTSTCSTAILTCDAVEGAAISLALAESELDLRNM